MEDIMKRIVLCW